MPQRILHIIDSLGATGAAHQLLVLANGLAEQGREVQITALDDGGPLAREFAALRIPTTVIGRRGVFDPIAFLRLRRHIANVEPHVIHTWTRDATYCAWAAGWSRGRQSVLDNPTPRVRFIMGVYRIERYKPAWQWSLERRIAAGAHQVVTNSRTVRNWCVANGVPTDKLAVILSGVAPAQASDVTRDELLRELRLPPDAKLIGVVGRLTSEKRVRDLIWAADLLRVLHDNLRLLVIGDGPLRIELERYARLASDLDHIQFLGERDDVWRIMPHLDALWNGSENVSPSVAILEAMAAGVPIIASDVSVNRELVIHGETGYLIPIGSRAGRAARARLTGRIFSEHEVAECISANCRQRAHEEFAAADNVARHVDLYERPVVE